MKKSWFVVAVLLLSAAVSFGAGKKLFGKRIALDRPDGIYHVGETATCRFKLLKNGVPCVGVRMRMTLRREGKIIDSVEFVTTDKPASFPYKADRPGWIYFGFEMLGDDGVPLRDDRIRRHSTKPTIFTEIGALFEPDKIVTGV